MTSSKLHSIGFLTDVEEINNLMDLYSTFKQLLKCDYSE